MKKVVLIALAIFSILSIQAQINMNSIGNVLLGSGTPSSSFKLYINGESFHACNTSPASGFSFKGYNVGSSTFVPMILPYSNNNMFLGNYDMMLNRIYTYNLNVNGVWITSDFKLKENIRPLTGSLNNILLLNTVLFDYKPVIYNDSSTFEREKLIANGKDNSGFLV